MNSTNDKPVEIPVEIDAKLLSEDALNGVIENFILREGTDYGVQEVAYLKKKEQVERQISRGDVKIIYDQSTETVSLITANEFRKLQKKTGPEEPAV